MTEVGRLGRRTLTMVDVRLGRCDETLSRACDRSLDGRTGDGRGEASGAVLASPPPPPLHGRRQRIVEIGGRPPHTLYR